MLSGDEPEKLEISPREFYSRGRFRFSGVIFASRYICARLRGPRENIVIYDVFFSIAESTRTRTHGLQLPQKGPRLALCVGPWAHPQAPATRGGERQLMVAASKPLAHGRPRRRRMTARRARAQIGGIVSVRVPSLSTTLMIQLGMLIEKRRFISAAHSCMRASPSSMVMSGFQWKSSSELQKKAA